MDAAIERYKGCLGVGTVVMPGMGWFDTGGAKEDPGDAQACERDLEATARIGAHRTEQ